MTCMCNHKDTDHSIRCPKRNRHRATIIKAIDRMEKELDPVLHLLMKEGLKTYLQEGKAKCSHVMLAKAKEVNPPQNSATNISHTELNQKMNQRVKDYFDSDVYEYEFELEYKLHKQTDDARVYERYELLIKEKNRIGWDNILRGKISKQWSKLQGAYKHRKKLQSHLERPTQP